LNRGFYDAYNAGLLCVAITNRTTSFISSGLFKTFLPSLGLVTGGKDVPMMILLRPTQPPYVRIGRNTTKQNPDGSTSPDDPLLTLSFKQLNLDFYALVDERQVRMFTLQADLLLPLGLRTFSDPNADTLQPVLGSLDQLLTNITALSPQGGAYSAKDMLAEDPGVVKDLLGAAVRLAQPLLAGVLKPIVLPSMLGLRFGVTGLAGAVPLANVAADGYAHLALWTSITECAGTCEQVAAKVDARVVNRVLPDDPEEIRQGSVPMIELEPRATLPHSGARAEFSYRVDGSLWSPWLGVSRLVLRDPLFLVQGHHFIEVTAREAGDDRTMDPQPVGIDFFVSYEAPTVEVFQRADGALATRAHSAATREDALLFSYRVDGEQGWSRPGAARSYSAAELNGRGLTVSISDEAGRSAQAHFGAAEAEVLVQRSAAAGCSTSSRTTSAGLLPLLLAALVWRRRQRKGSTSGA
jgi:MYXO-CTERM domain-containing protein